MVVALVATLGVPEQDEEHDERPEQQQRPAPRGVPDLGDLRHGAQQPDGSEGEEAGAAGEDVADDVDGVLVGGGDDGHEREHAEEGRERAGSVGGERLQQREAGAPQDQEVGDLLRELVQADRERDHKAFEGAALPEGSGGDDAVDKVAKEVAGEDVRDQRPLDQRQAPNLVQVRGDHRLDGEDRERSVWILGLVGAFRDVLERMGA
mmetsp:Transcript_49297/g.116159  ORF Transcript_49297/g.116159 Transcript_49297/m.116159 type:complete len:207 (+) Transcript_49297:171-791(+)